MSIIEDYLRFADTIASQIKLPRIASIHLPKIVGEQEKRDEFGFVILEDQSVGPFYTSLEESLQDLWQQLPDGGNGKLDTLEMIHRWQEPSLAAKALALGAYNAMSHHVMRHSGYSPASVDDGASNGISKPVAGDTVGMVGFFRPLIEQYLEGDIKLLILEKNPARVVLQPGLTLSVNPQDLATCQHILCTASTLVNDSLGVILANSRNAKSFSLIGPSGSGLPDILFKHGVDAVGGIFFEDIERLQSALAVQESWGKAGHKYNLTRQAYPGIESLLQGYSSA